MSEVIMYTTAICPYCVAAKNFLKSRGSGYTEVRVDIDPVARAAMMEQSKRTSVPQIFINGTHVGGYDDTGRARPRRRPEALAGDGTVSAGDEADRVQAFTEFRQRMNDRILGQGNQVVKRFFALDTQTYKDGALDVKTKELLGLVASMVLRCDDCISYHIAQCKDAGVNRDEFFETFSVAPGGRRFDRDPASAPGGGFPRPARGRRYPRRQARPRPRLRPGLRPVRESSGRG